ncbi:potassium/proton antiporter [Sporichthya brevicatena]
MDPQDLNVMLVAGCGVVLLAVLAVRLTTRSGLPTLLLYLALGLAIGEDGLGVELDDFQLAQNLALIALALILGDGGLTTRLDTLRPAGPLALVLATVGVAISVGVTAAGAYWLLDMDLRTALLLGAIVSSTDAAAVFAVLRRLPLKPRLAATLEAESGLNDAPVVVLVMLLASDAWDGATPWGIGAQVLYQLVVGAVIGLAVAWAGHWVLARAALPTAGLYPLATLSILLLAYATASVAGASGIIGVYLAGILLGNSTLPHHRATLAFSEGSASLAQIGLFVLLGLLADPSRLPGSFGEALIAGVVLTFVARPLSVVVLARPMGLNWRESAFVSWAGLRGAVPIVLTTVPAAAGVAGSEQIFDIVFLLVVVFVLLQGPTLPWAARVAGVTDETPTHEIAIESAPLDELRADVLEVDVPPGSRLAGVWTADLRLPRGAALVLIVRDGQPDVPDAHSVLRVGDQLLIVTTRAVRAETEQRLRAVGRSGRLAGWLESR